MAANTWLAKLNITPEDACRCGHNAHVHLHGKSCTAIVDESKMRYCKCEEFRLAGVKNSNDVSQGDNMATKTKKERKPKGEGRTPTLAPYAEAIGGKKIYMNHDGKEHEATVLGSGVIRMGEKDYTSPSSAGSAILGKDKKGKPRQVDGWKSWYFNKDGNRVQLDTLRGSKSPLADATPKAAPKRTKKAASKANGSTSAAARPKRVRKPKTAHEAPAAGAETASEATAS